MAKADQTENYQERISEHYRNPRNFGKITGKSLHGSAHNPACGDDIEIYLKVEDGKITDVKFHGKGCGVSLASASMFTEMVRGMTVGMAKKLKKEDIFKMLGVKKIETPRVVCALLCLNAFLKGLDQSME